MTYIVWSIIGVELTFFWTSIKDIDGMDSIGQLIFLLFGISSLLKELRDLHRKKRIDRIILRW